MTADSERARILAIEDERQTFGVDVDGFVKWWPASKGYLESHHLRWIADELDRRNAPWVAQIERDLGIRGSDTGSRE